MQEKQDNCALKNQSQLMCHSYADKRGSTPFSSSDRLKTACWWRFMKPQMEDKHNPCARLRGVRRVFLRKRTRFLRRKCLFELLLRLGNVGKMLYQKSRNDLTQGLLEKSTY